ncbi:hypothetical protein ABZ897_49855 [Nonomuraea sp. NPDC046802]|uniref:hypothetical protein n=1 Tax=Nonomuraea sp. NPDC046802 TaxID=3154919 RepID=UPI0033F572B5
MLVEALLTSEIFNEQVNLLARKPPMDKVRSAILVLLDSGTLPSTALGQRLGLAFDDAVAAKDPSGCSWFLRK